MLDFAENKEVQDIMPDYGKPTETVFTDFARSRIERSGLSNMLNKVEFSDESVIKVPSWVPDWKKHPLNGPGQPYPLVDYFRSSYSLPDDFGFFGEWEGVTGTGTSR